MLKLYVDSVSSIKQDEKEKYNLEIFPLRFLIDDVEYLDGINITIDEFYEKLLGQKIFPKTSLPQIDLIQNEIDLQTSQGNDCLIITLSSGISGTYDTLYNMFKDYKNVRVVDSLSACGGIRLLVEEVNRYRDESLDFIVQKLEELKPRIKIFAIPETLEYLHKGGRLSKKDYIVGSVLNIKPIISIIKGKVTVVAKKIGLRMGMKAVANELIASEFDENYPIIASYTYNYENLEKLKNITDPKFLPFMTVNDNLDPALACHWGPNAFGYIFIGKK